VRNKDPLLNRFGLRSKSQRIRYDKFVREYMLSCDATKSYKKVFPGNIDTTNKRNGYLLVRHPYVIYELNRKNKEIDKKMDKKIIMNRERILTELEEILLLTKGKEQYPAALKALDQLARVTGSYAPEKSEVEHKGITINYVKPGEVEDNINEFFDGCPDCEEGTCVCDIKI
jgi:hypothetical protein|tara:strand:+ start:1132 stop:1647 length:516 start_codon:yes stop_codon:yes gene_type:complete